MITDLLTILLIIGILYVLAKITDPSVWGMRPPRKCRENHLKRGEKPYGLPWMGGTIERKKKNYFGDD